MENIVIIGGGHVGLTLAIDLEIRKHETALLPHIVLLRKEKHPFAERLHTQVIEMEDILSGDVSHCVFPQDRVHHLGSDIGAVVEDVAAIVVAVPDIPLIRRKLLEWVKSNASDGATVILVRGGQGGQISVIAEWRDDPRLGRLNMILIEDSFYGTRYLDHKIAFKRKLCVNVSSFGPAPEHALRMLQKMFSGPSVKERFHKFNPVRPLDLQFDPLGYIIHLAVALDKTNLELTRKKIQYLHYSAGVHEHNADLIESLDKERVALAAQYGAKTQSFTEILQLQYGLEAKSSFLEMMTSTNVIYRSLSESSIDALRKSRMIQEDIPGLLTMEWLARASGANLPMIHEYADSIRAALIELGIDVSAHQDYIRQMESKKLDRNTVIDLLTNPY